MSKDTVKSLYDLVVNEVGFYKTLQRQLTYDAVFSQFIKRVIASGFRDLRHGEDHIDYSHAYYEWVESVGGDLKKIYFMRESTNPDAKTSIVVAPYGLDKEGNGKSLSFEADLSRQDDREFSDDMKFVAATKPKNLQEFLTRLVDHQKEKSKSKNNGLD